MGRIRASGNLLGQFETRDPVRAPSPRRVHAAAHFVQHAQPRLAAVGEQALPMGQHDDGRSRAEQLGGVWTAVGTAASAAGIVLAKSHSAVKQLVGIGSPPMGFDISIPRLPAVQSVIGRVLQSSAA